jgi:hypothetical protein
MPMTRYSAYLAALVAALALHLPMASAQDSDMAEVQRYTLTDAGLAKFIAASRNLAAVPGACEVEADEGSQDESADSQSIDDMVAKIESLPGATAAIQSAGMTSREFIVFSWSILQNGMAAWASDQPGGKLPPGVRQENVDFMKSHEAELQKIGEDDPCGAQDDDEEGDG